MDIPISARAAIDAGPTAPAPGRVSASAHEFEAMTIGQMLQPMFDTLGQDGMFDGGAAEQTLRPMLITEFAKIIEARGGLGLEKPIEAALSQQQRGRTE